MTGIGIGNGMSFKDKLQPDRPSKKAVKVTKEEINKPEDKRDESSISSPQDLP